MTQEGAPAPTPRPERPKTAPTTPPPNEGNRDFVNRFMMTIRAELEVIPAEEAR